MHIEIFASILRAKGTLFILILLLLPSILVQPGSKIYYDVTFIYPLHAFMCLRFFTVVVACELQA